MTEQWTQRRSRRRRKVLFLLAILFETFPCSVGGPASFFKAVEGVSRRGQTTLSQQVLPALSVFKSREGRESPQILEASTKQRKIIPKEAREAIGSQLQTGGFYYGISSQTMGKASQKQDEKTPRLKDSMLEALEELRLLRHEMEAMRKEMQRMKRKMIGDDMEEDSEEAKAQALMMTRKRQKEAERIAADIEKWAYKILGETEEDGWKEVSCNQMMRSSLNPTGRTKVYLKWLPDSRGEKADRSNEEKYPCIKCVSTIDAPMEDVCTYLSDEKATPEYNDVVVKYKDIEEISPSAKICWSQSPQILFLKPRDFVTFCHHRWKRDGAEVIVNQAWDHPDYPANNEDKEGKACRAHALRGANFISRLPADPNNKTQMTIIAHANPGGGLPKWASKTAVNALAPIEPFKLFHKINTNVKQNSSQLRARIRQAEMVSSSSTLPNGRSPQPGGMAQLGYACFWPNGGGVKEGGFKPPVPLPSDEEVNHDPMSEAITTTPETPSSPLSTTMTTEGTIEETQNAHAFSDEDEAAQPSKIAQAIPAPPASV